MLAALALSAALLAAIAWMNFAVRERWRYHHASKPVRLTDGEEVRDQLVMRRKTKMGWEYRLPTPEERMEDDTWHAIR